MLTDGKTISEILLDVDTVWLKEIDSKIMVVTESTVENRDWDLL